MDLAIYRRQIAASAGVGLCVLSICARPQPSRRAEHQSDVEARLREIWSAQHPGAPVPVACEYADEVFAGNEVLADPEPQPVLVLASDRFGVALVTRDREHLLAYAEGDGCAPAGTARTTWYNTEWIGTTPSASPFLIRRDASSDARARDLVLATLYRRRGAALDRVLVVIEHDFDQTGWDGHRGIERFTELTREAPGAGELVLDYEQRVSASPGPEVRMTGTCTLRIDRDRLTAIDRAACRTIAP